jgi:hypothetical protein
MIEVCLLCAFYFTSYICKDGYRELQSATHCVLSLLPVASSQTVLCTLLSATICFAVYLCCLSCSFEVKVRDIATAAAQLPEVSSGM